MSAYPPPVPQPGDPGDVSAARGRPVRLALLAFTVCLSGAAAGSGLPLTLSAAPHAVVVSAPPAAIRAPAPVAAPAPARTSTRASTAHPRLHRAKPTPQPKPAARPVRHHT